MATLDRNTTLNKLIIKLEQILGPSGIDALGQYNLVSGTQVLQTVCSIKIEYPRFSSDIKRDLVPESGIECIIYSEPNLIANRLAGNNYRDDRYFPIVLDQWDPVGGLTEAVQALLQDRELFITETPIIRGEIEKQDKSGFLPPRAILYHQQAQFIEGN